MRLRFLIIALAAFLLSGLVAVKLIQGQTVVVRYYAPTSFWNIPIAPGSALDQNSANIVKTAMLPYVSHANFTNSPAWGIGVAPAQQSSPLQTVKCLKYGCGNTVTFHIPIGAKPSTGSDHSLRVLLGSQELDMWQAAYSGTGGWSAGSRYIEDLYGWGACGAPHTHCNGPVAAGYAGMGGIVRPEEIQQGHIDHALVAAFTLTRAHYIACPATHTDGNSSNQYSAPEGMHFRLNPAFPVAAQNWPQWEKTLAVALQTYGAYVGDTGGTIAFYGQTDQNTGNIKWSTVGVPENGAPLSNLPWAQMQVLTIQSCN